MNNYKTNPPIWKQYIAYILEKYATGRLRCDSAVRDITSICNRYGLTYVLENFSYSVDRYGAQRALGYMREKYA